MTHRFSIQSLYEQAPEPVSDLPSLASDGDNGKGQAEGRDEPCQQGSLRRPTYKVLVVEDDPHIGRLLLANLGRAGLEARLALDGAAGLDSFHSHPPHIVLLDMVMPVMDGFQVCEKIREESQVPVIIMTARLEPVHRMHGFRLGADDYVLKPFDPQLLVARVIAHLRRVYRYDGGHIRRKGVLEPAPATAVTVEEKSRGSIVTADSQGQETASTLEAHLPEGWAGCKACNYMAPPDHFPRRFTTPQSAVVTCPNCGELGKIRLDPAAASVPNTD